jgi:hypothetical protein
LLLLTVVASCRASQEDEEAKQAVRAYLTRVIDAYRVSDAELTDPVASDREVRKLTGLIGVKRDSGVNLHAELLDLQFERVEKVKDGFSVSTREKWTYRDLAIGTGKQVGEGSTDSYRMVYKLERDKDRWVVGETAFSEEPVIGRKFAPVTTDVRTLHGLPPAGQDEEKK